MSDLGVLSHAYTEWNDHLGEMNCWLLDIRKMKDGLVEAKEDVGMPPCVRKVLADIAQSIDSFSDKATSAIPLTIKEKLVHRLEEKTEGASHRLSKLLASARLSLDDLSDEDILLLRTIVASLDDEVNSLYNRMYRYR